MTPKESLELAGRQIQPLGDLDLCHRLLDSVFHQGNGPQEMRVLQPTSDTAARSLRRIGWTYLRIDEHFRRAGGDFPAVIEFDELQ